jgi:tetratricopeptide (TPR) repeat protein
LDEAQTAARQALEIREKHLGAVTPEVIEATLTLGRALQMGSKPEEAASLYRARLAALEQAGSTDSIAVSDLLYATAALEYGRKSYSAAEPLYLRALRTREQAGAAAPGLRGIEIRRDLGRLYRELGRNTQAQAAFERAIEQANELQEGRTELLPGLLIELADVRAAQSQYSDAEPLFVRALGLSEELYGRSGVRTVPALDAGGRFFRDRGRYLEAEEHFERAVAILEERAPNHADLPAARNNLATVYRLRGRYDNAEKLYRRSLAALENTFGPNDPEVATALSNIAEVSLEMGKADAAQRLLDRAVSILKQGGPSVQDRLPATMDQLAKAYFTGKKYNEAEKTLRASLEVSRAVLGPGHPDTARTLSYLATLEATQGHFGEAQKLYEQALENLEGAVGKDHVAMAPILEDYAALLRMRKRDAEAALALDRAERIRRQAASEKRP